MFESNSDIIRSLVPPFVAKVNASKRSLGMHHNRTQDPANTIAKYKSKGGEIYCISFNLNKGEVMSHKGVGGRGQDNRHPKEFYNPNAEEFMPQLADALAQNTGDVICGRLCIQ